MPKKVHQKYRKYTDEFRAEAVALVYSKGYPDAPGALTKAASDLAVSRQLLTNWVTGARNPPPQNLLQEKKQDLRSMFEAEIHAILDLMPEKRNEATYSQLTVALGIMFDKFRLLQNLPTEIVSILPVLMTSLTDRGLDPIAVFKAMNDRLLLAPGKTQNTEQSESES